VTDFIDYLFYPGRQRFARMFAKLLILLGFIWAGAYIYIARSMRAFMKIKGE
jgi:flagellar biogenesis protein FliO